MTDINSAIHPLDFAETAMRDGRDVAVATVIAAWPAAPVQPGQQMAIDDMGTFVGAPFCGSVGQMVEATAQMVIKSGLPELLELKVTNDEAGRLGLSNGGALRIYVERVG